MKKIILIDGNAIFHRAYHSIPPFKTSQGEVTNAIYGFLRMLFDLLKKENPDYIAIAWDRAAPTFRSETYQEYKAQRAAPPDDLYPQLPRLKQLLELFHIPLFEMDGYEADDILGTLACQAKTNPDLFTFILTGDKDALQLVNGNTTVMTPLIGLSKVKLYDPIQVERDFGVKPQQIIDYKALCGDNSDNIPGVPGIGPKQATALLQKYQTFENVYQHLEELSPGQRKKLEEGREKGFMSKKLVTMQCDAPIHLELEKYQPQATEFDKIRKLFEELEFNSLVKKLEELEKNSTQSAAVAENLQQSLF